MNNDYDNDFTNLQSTDGERMALQSVHIDGLLEGLLLQMTIRQKYRNQTGNNLETVYTFPLPWGASLMGMDIEINGKRLAATVIAKQEATKRYEKAIDDGDMPVMIEQSGMGLFTANLGNLKDGEEATIEVRYAQLQRFEQDQIRIMVPTTIAPRFGDEHKEGKLAPHESAQFDLLAEYPFTLILQIQNDLNGASIHSPSHKITTKLDGSNHLISLDRGGFMDRDFVLNLSGLKTQSTAVCAKDGDQYSVIASFCPKFETIEQKPLALKILVDCSGSMAGDSINSAKRALHQVLQELGKQDSISYSKFGDKVQHTYRKMQKCTPTYIKEFSNKISQTDADMGGTETYDALMSVFNDIKLDESEYSIKNPVNVLMITDGSIWNTEKVIEASKNSNHRIFTICVGSAANDNLVSELAEKTGGAAEMVAPNENIEQAIVRTFHRLRHAESMELHVDWGCKPLWESELPFGVFDNDTVHVFARFNSEHKQAPVLKWTGIEQIGSAKVEAIKNSENDLVPRMVGSQQIKHTESDEEISALAIKYQLVTNQTNLFLVHIRAEEDKASELPKLQIIAHMQAAGWAGQSTVLNSSVCNSYSSMEVKAMRAPALWRRESAAETARTMKRNVSESYDTPAFFSEESEYYQPLEKIITPKQFLYFISETGKINTWLHGISSNIDETELPKIVIHVINELSAIYYSRDKAWSIFIEWLAQHLQFDLPRHIERAIRNEIKDISKIEKNNAINIIKINLTNLDDIEWENEIII
jgi:Ca-activated chloride channel family protein